MKQVRVVFTFGAGTITKTWNVEHWGYDQGGLWLDLSHNEKVLIPTSNVLYIEGDR